MSLIGNILWIVLGGGIFLFLEYLIGGMLLCLTIVGIPFGVQCIKLSMLALLPFGAEIGYAESVELTNYGAPRHLRIVSCVSSSY